MSSLAAIQFVIVLFALAAANIVLGAIRYIYRRIMGAYFLKHNIHSWIHYNVKWITINDPGEPTFPPYDQHRLPSSVKMHIGVFTYIIGSVTAAALISVSFLMSELGSINSECITEQLQIELASIPIIPVMFLVLLGAVGLACSALFVITPDSWVRVRRVQAMTIILVALCLCMFFWVILYQIIASASIGPEGLCE